MRTIHTPTRPTAALAQTVTRDASKQTYYTIRLLVPCERRDDAFRAYAYFRWVDDLLDGDMLHPKEQHAFLTAQKELLSQCLQGRPPRNLCSEEWLLVDLTQGSMREDPGLMIYLQDMMAVMEFDVLRRNRRINRRELAWYSRRLATAVTEAVYTFIGDQNSAPRTVERYKAADAAHIVHMLRDLHEDLESGYINIPIEVLDGEQVDPAIISSDRVCTWVRERVETARVYFTAGETYLSMIENPRCRTAGAWYAARFTGVLDAIEREDYLLRRDYSDCKGVRTMLRMAARGLMAFTTSPTPSFPVPTQPEPIRSPAWGRPEIPHLLREDNLKE
jgi:phytoene/squalene synthetase